MGVTTPLRIKDKTHYAVRPCAQSLKRLRVTDAVDGVACPEWLQRIAIPRKGVCLKLQLQKGIRRHEVIEEIS